MSDTDGPSIIPPFLTDSILFALDTPAYVKQKQLEDTFGELSRYGPIAFLKREKVWHEGPAEVSRDWAIMFSTIEQAEIALAMFHEEVIAGCDMEPRTVLQLSPWLRPFVLPRKLPFPQFIQQPGNPGPVPKVPTNPAFELFHFFRTFGPLVSLKMTCDIGQTVQRTVIRFWHIDSAVAASKTKGIITQTLRMPQALLNAYNPRAILCLRLPPALDKAQIKELFKEHGPVTNVSIFSKSKKNSGVVHFSTEAGALQAKNALNGTLLEGTRIDIRTHIVKLQPPSPEKVKKRDKVARDQVARDQAADKERQKVIERLQEEALRQEKGERRQAAATEEAKVHCDPAKIARERRECRAELRRAREHARLELEEASLDVRFTERKLVDVEIARQSALEALRDANIEANFAALWRAEAIRADCEAREALAVARGISDDADAVVAAALRAFNRSQARKSVAQSVWDALPPEEPDSPRSPSPQVQPEDHLQESIRKMQTMRKEEERDRLRKKAGQTGPQTGASETRQKPPFSGPEDLARAQEEQKRARQERERAREERERAQQEREDALLEQEKARQEQERARVEHEKAKRELERAYEALERMKREQEELIRVRETLLQVERDREEAMWRAQEEGEKDEKFLRGEEQRKREQVERNEREKHQREEERRVMEEVLERGQALRQEKMRVEAEQKAKEERERQELHRQQVAEAIRQQAWKEATAQETLRCQQREDTHWPRRPDREWTAAIALARYNALSDEFDAILFSEQRPLTFLSIPWPVFPPPYDLKIDLVEWSTVEAFFRIVRPTMLPQSYKVLVEKSHRRFHPDKWQRRLNSVQDATLKETLERMLIVVSQALTPIWTESKEIA